MDEGPVFELEIERIRTRYQARVRRSPAGSGGRSSFALPDEDAIASLGSELGSRHLGMDAPRREIKANSFGRRLFEAAFTGSVLEAWQASVLIAQGDLLLRLRLENDPRLLKVPWELLFDPKQGAFVATKIRVVRSLDLAADARHLSTPPPLRILVVLSSPSTVAPLDTDREWAALDGALGAKVQLSVVRAQLEEVDRALRSGAWHILHFVGHGSTDDEGGVLILEDRHGEARAVDHLRLRAFLSHPSLRLVVLNACEGARPGRSNASSGVAQALLKEGVPAVLAMQQAISDSTAIAFSKHFYGALGEDLTLGGALLEARRALYRDGEPGWAIPVLYSSRPDGRLSDAPPLPPSSRTLRVVIGIVAGVVLLGLLGLWINRLVSHPKARSLVGPLPPRPPRSATENPKECPSPGDLNIAFEKIDAGIFEMGGKRSKSTKPVHKVRITSPYCLSAYEVTRELWSRVLAAPMPRNEDRYLPVQGITFEEARQFMSRLNQIDPSGHYRLPTEAEWEKAARAGQRTLYHFGDDEASLPLYGNCKGKDGFEEVAPVGQLKANSEGLYDIYGNVFEWVEGWYEPYPAKDLVDPLGPVEGEKRIRRGGGWDSGARACTSAHRSIVLPDWSDKYTGFRIVRNIR